MTGPNRSVLVIDDSASFRTVVAMALERASFRVEQADDGVTALDCVRSKRFDLIICDINMPRMDGISFVKAAKASEHGKFTPVLMLTTSTNPAQVEAARAAGAKAWLNKPFEPAQLMTAVTRLVGA